MGKTHTLHEAAEQGDLASVQSLIENGADIDAPGQKLYTPLHYAAKNNHAQVVEYLVQQGANVLLKALSSTNAIVPRVTPLDLATDVDVLAILKPVYEQVEKQRKSMARVRVSMSGKKLFSPEAAEEEDLVDEEFDTLLEAYMLKEGGGTTWKSRKNWTKRFFTLKRGQTSGATILSYAKESGEDSLNELIVDESCEVKRAAREGIALCFALVTKGRTLFIKASSATMYEAWITALEQAVQEKRDRLGEGKKILYEGFLMKEGGQLKNWKKRWVRLVQATNPSEVFISYKASPADIEELGTVGLNDRSKVEKVDNNNIRVITTERTLNLKAVSASQEQEISEWIDSLSNVLQSLTVEESSTKAKTTE